MAASEPQPGNTPDTDASTESLPVQESVWLDVIHRMDEVYAQLVQDEIALEGKNAELEQSNRFISSVLSSMSDLVVACDDDGRIQQINPALAALLDLPGERLIGQDFQSLLNGPEDQARLAALKAAMAPGSGQTRPATEVHLRDAAGRCVPVELHVSPRQDASGATAGHVLVGRPVGELRRAYQQLQEAHVALKNTQQQLLHSEKMASLGRLVAGVAHELNNPISFVLGNTHALSRYLERIGSYLAQVHGQPLPAGLEEERQRLKIDRLMQDLPGLIAGTLEGAQRTAEIVAGLKRFSATHQEPIRPVALLDAVERALHWVRKGADLRFTVQLDVAPDLQVLAAPGPLLQVFMNLIQNAHDAASSSGIGQPGLRIAARLRESTVELRFIDNGPGVPEALRGRIFDPFFTTKPVGKGTGLGLSISYGILEQLGGRLSLEDPRAGEGACFLVQLPMARESV
jgi:two-component system sensor histidine kinase HupT/HoxJ